MKDNSSKLMLKNLNRRIVLNYMRSNENVTKSGVAQVTGLTFMAIQKIISRLQELSLVRTDKYDTGKKIGRKDLYYTINENYAYAIGVHINRSVTRAAVVDLKGNIISETEFKMEIELESHSALIKMLVTIIQKVIEQSNVDPLKILGIGVGLPGPVNIQEGIVLSPPNFPSLEYLPLANILQGHFPYPVMLQKDTNAIALGEYWNGAGRGSSYMVYIDLDIGIGSGLIIDGKINSGANQLAGEFGHITLEVDGPMCTCGNKGCLEALSSGLSLLKEFKAKLGTEKEHPLYERRKELKIKDFLAAVEKNDLLALSMLNKAAIYTGIAINNLINILDPQIVVIGGTLVENQSRYMIMVKSIIDSRKLKGTKDREIKSSILFSQAGVIGAGEIIIDKFFNDLVNSVLSNDEL